MTTKTKRQHYLPKSYLSSFATKCKKARMVYIIINSESHCKFVSIDDICLCNDLYEQKYKDDTGNEIYINRNSIENSFIGIEGKYKSVINKLDSLHLKSNDEMISDEDRNILSKFMALTILRHPIFVNLSKQYVKQNIKSLSSCGDSKHILDITTFAFLKYFLSMDDHALYIPAMQSTISENNAFILKAKNHKFITSDCPIINLDGEYKNVKFDMIGFPISPDYFFAFIDSANDFNNRVILIGDEFVDFLNLYQVHSKSAKMLISKEEYNLSRYIGENSR
ncbi:MAG: DUF4238 domain-containing protein [Clostridia bacterium]|nr:DUF4238 domain-containing protein [Clostridia bacterium]